MKKNLLVISIRASRAFLVLPTKTKSSANRRAEMLIVDVFKVYSKTCQVELGTKIIDE